MIGIIGYGMVGKAVKYGFSKHYCHVSDPKYNSVTVEDICRIDPPAIFVCVPTPTDDTKYKILTDVLTRISNSGYTGLIVVKSTVLPQYLEQFNVIYNPEFLSRATAKQDFVKPPFVLIGGDRAEELVELYKTESIVDMSNVFITDVRTAAFAKYTMNSFYATKITFMNSMFDVATKLGVDWEDIIPILKAQPWMGTHHFEVPGPDGSRGFGGPCLPKDTEALVKEFDVNLLAKVLELNNTYRNKKD
jgi:nucleotide sugar dehydrogenase